MRRTPTPRKADVLRGILRFDDILPETPHNIGEIMERCPNILDHLESREIENYMRDVAELVQGRLGQKEFDSRPLTQRYNRANAKLERDTERHRRKLEKEHHIEWSKWAVTSDGKARVWITCRYEPPDRTYSKDDINRFLADPQAMCEIPGWRKATGLQREKVENALWLALEEMR